MVIDLIDELLYVRRLFLGLDQELARDANFPKSETVTDNSGFL